MPPSPQASWSDSIATTSTRNMPPSIFCFVNRLNPAPSRATPKTGKNSAYSGRPLRCKFRSSDALGAVVEIVSVAVAVPFDARFKDARSSAQVGGAVAGTGVTTQSRLTIPLNDPDGVTTMLNVAVCPAPTVCEMGDPEAAVKAKSGTGSTTRATAAVFTVDSALPCTCTE